MGGLAGGFGGADNLDECGHISMGGESRVTSLPGPLVEPLWRNRTSVAVANPSVLHRDSKVRFSEIEAGLEMQTRGL